MRGPNRHHHVLVVQGDVIKDVDRIGSIHSVDAVFNNRCHLVCKCWVVCLTCRNSACENKTVSVLMLQTFAHESGATGSCTHQESACARICGLPNQVANTLETKHGIEGVKRHHRYAACGVASTSSDETAHGACFGDAFFKNLALCRLCIRQQQVVINRLILLSL